MILTNLMSDRYKLLTVKLPTDLYIDFSTAVAVKMERTMTGFVHRLVVRAVREAQEDVSEAKWKQIRDSHRVEIEQNAKLRRQQAKKGKVPVRTIELKQPHANKRRHG